MRRALGVFVLILGAAAYLAFPGIQALRSMHSNDFKHIYLGMQALTDGEDPYRAEPLVLAAIRHGMIKRNSDFSLNPYVYLPFTGLALAFMKPLSFAAAALLWFLLNHVMVLASVSLFLRSARVGSYLWYGAALLVLAFTHPFLKTLTAGQLNCVLLLCNVAALALVMRGKQVAAGGIMGFAAMFKIAPAIFALYFALTRQWRALGSMLLTCFVLLVVSLAAVGWEPHRDFIPMLKQMRYGHSTWEPRATFWKDPPNQSINSLATHALVARNGIATPWLPGTQDQANAVTLAASLLLIGLYLAVFWRTRSSAAAGNPGRMEGGFHATVMLSLLVPSLMWDHYLLLALPPAGWLFVDSIQRRRYVTLALTLLSLVLISIPWRFDGPAFTSGVGVLLMSMKLFPALVIFVLLCASMHAHPLNHSRRPDLLT